MTDSEYPSDLDVALVGPSGEQVAAPVEALEPDSVCAEAVSQASSALTDEIGVGDHIGLVAEGPLVVTHHFAGSVPGYRGWCWAVTVSRRPDSADVTVDEVHLVPSPDALLAPAWVPWKHRVRAEDLRKGHVVVTEADDPRLLYGYEAVDAEVDDPTDELRPVQWELGLGRVRLLSPTGRAQAAERWWSGPNGPQTGRGLTDARRCRSCGFMALIGGPLGQAFGACANALSPADGQVVSLDYACGAHSEIGEDSAVAVAELVVDESGYEDLAPDLTETEAPESGIERSEAPESGSEQTEAPDGQRDPEARFSASAPDSGAFEEEEQ